MVYKKLRVGIICGGCSAEHNVSLQSALYIEKFIDKNRFEPLILWINKTGDWYIIKKKDFNLFFINKINQSIELLLQYNSSKFNFNFNKLLKLDVIFPIIHGSFGEDGSLQGFLRIINLPYVGSDVLGSAICMNKDITKHLLHSFNLPIVPFKTYLLHERSNINFNNLINFFGLPLFVKPVDQGSSIGGSKVNTADDFNKSLDIAFSYSSKIIIEPFIVGRELECAVLGGYNPKASVCGEIIIKNNSFYTYYNKYIQYNTSIIIPATIDNTKSDTIRHISIQVFKVLRCFGLARIDFFLTKNNQIFINEVNTLPGFTNSSMYPKLWEATGLNTTMLLTKLIELALDRYYSI